MKIWVQRALSLSLVSILLAGCGGKGSVAVRPAAKSVSQLSDYTGLPGPALVQTLQDPKGLPMAFYELQRRNQKRGEVNAGDDSDYQEFIEFYHDPRVVVCPQENPQLPIYVVLSDMSSRPSLADADAYETPNLQELFLAPDGRDKLGASADLVIDAFTADGTSFMLFGNDNMLIKPGILADVNGDGRVERADHLRYGIEGMEDVTVSVFCIRTAQAKPQPLLTVLYDWCDDEWGYRFTDADQDGILDVELGPRTAAGIKTKVVYTWDKVKKAYVGPAGKEGDHFRLLEKETIYPDIKRLAEAKLVFPKDPDFVDLQKRMIDEAEKRMRPAVSQKPSQPYRPGSLKALSNADLLDYMGTGKQAMSAFGNGPLAQLPANFWTMEPKAAALAFANGCRHPEHQQRFRLAVDDRDGQKPPAEGSIALTTVSDPSYSVVDSHYFLRIDPKHSYLAYARSWAGGAVGYNVVNDQPAFDFRLCELPYKDARHLAETIWWLNRVRSLDLAATNGFSLSSGFLTSAYDHGRLAWRDPRGKMVLKLDETLWMLPISDQWKDNYNRSICLNLAAFLITDALTERLGKPWSTFEPKHSQSPFRREAGAPQYDSDEMKNLQTLAGTFLEWFSLDQTRISYPIVSESAQLAGAFASAEFAGRLERIQKRLPAINPAKRTTEMIEAEIKPLESIKPEDPAWKKTRQQLEKLRNEFIDLCKDADAQDLDNLRDELSISLKQIRCATDLQALQDLACSDDDGAQWALQRLKAKDKQRYVVALEWLMKHSADNGARQVFEEIAREDPQRAAKLAKEIPAATQGDLSVSAFVHLAKANEIPDQPKRLQALIAIALDPMNGWQERGAAIDALVPPGQPLRYPNREIDDALLKLLDPKLADVNQVLLKMKEAEIPPPELPVPLVSVPEPPELNDDLNFTLGRACRALARRGRTEYFDKLEAALTRAGYSIVYDDVLGAIAHLAQADPANGHPRLLAILKPQLKKTNRQMTPMLMAAWAADLRELKPDLETLATSSQNDCEDEKANSCGGEVSAVDGCFHLARKIVAMWNEEDPATRCRLLLAFGFNDGYGFILGMEPRAECLARMKSELAGLAQTLTPEQKQQVAAFLKWYQDEHLAKQDAQEREINAKFITMAKELLRLP